MTYARSPETRKVASSGFRVNGLTRGWSLRFDPGRVEHDVHRAGLRLEADERGELDATEPADVALAFELEPHRSCRDRARGRRRAFGRLGGDGRLDALELDFEGRQARQRRLPKRGEDGLPVDRRSLAARDDDRLLPLHGHAGGDSALGERRQLVRQRGATRLVDAQHRLYVPVHGERDRERAEASGERFACGVVGGPLARRAVYLEDVGRRHPQRLASDHDLDRLVQPCADFCVDARPRVGRREAADVDSGHRDAGQNRVPERVRAREKRNSGHRDHQRRHEEHRARSPETLNGARKACGDLGHGPRRLAANAAYHHAKCSKRILYGHCPR